MMSDIAAQTERARAARAAFDTVVLKIPGVTGTGIGLKYVDGVATNTLALVAFVKSKGPRDAGETIPAFFSDLPTDVVESTLEIDRSVPVVQDTPPLNGDFNKYQPLRSGCAVSPTINPEGVYCTLGPLVYNFETGKEAFLAAGHTFKNVPMWEQFSQPPLTERAGWVTGLWSDKTIPLDYVSLELFSRSASTVGLIGRQDNGWTEPEVGSQAQKYGVKTLLTEGTVTHIDVRPLQHVPYNNMALILGANNMRFTEGGDSGAPVFNDDYQMLGSVLGQVDYEGRYRTAIAPYYLLTERHDLNLGGGWRHREGLTHKAHPAGPAPSMVSELKRTHLVAKADGGTTIQYAWRAIGPGAWSNYSNLSDTLGFQSYWTPGLATLKMQGRKKLYVAGLWNDRSYTDAVWIGEYDWETGKAEKANLKQLKQLSSCEAIALTSYVYPAWGPRRADYLVVAFLDAVKNKPWIWWSVYSPVAGKITEAKAWSDARSIPYVEASDYPAIVVFRGKLVVAYRRRKDNRICLKRCVLPASDDKWEAEEDLGFESDSPLSMTCDEDRLLIVYKLGSKMMMISRHWKQPAHAYAIESPSTIPTRAISVASITLEKKKSAELEPSNFLMSVVNEDSKIDLWGMPANFSDG